MTEKLFIFKEGVLMFMDTLSLVLVIIGAINLGSMGLFGVDIVGALFGGTHAMLSRIVFTLIGLGGLWAITLLFRDRDRVHAHHNHHNRD